MRGPEELSGRQAADDGRLDSWKEIAAFLNRHVTTVRRWERHEGLPVHRHLHDKLGSVYAFRDELLRWSESRRVHLERPPAEPTDEEVGLAFADGAISADPASLPEPARAGGVPSPELGASPCVVRRRVSTWAAAALMCSVLLAAYGRPPSRTADREGPIESVAVLPLEALSHDPGGERFADAVTEALIGRLAQVRAISVISRRSAMSFKGSNLPTAQIAETLGVEGLVVGSVERVGDRVRISVRLIDARTDRHVWAADYERDAADILAMQAEVARAVADGIRIRVTPRERARMASAPGTNPAAYQEYLVGRYHLWRDDEENLRRAIRHFERATEIDPRYAAAYASLAHAWWKRGMWGPIGLAAAERPARAAARRALRLDAELPEAYVIEADLARLYDRDYDGAEQLLTRALGIDPNNLEAHYGYAILLMARGRFSAAIAHMEIAERLDPLSPAVLSDFGRLLYRAGRFEDAADRLTRALALEPGMSSVVQYRLGEVYEQMGMYEQALAAFQRAGSPVPEYAIARVYARMGKTREARRMLAGSTASGPAAVAAAKVHAALGQNDQAFELLFASAGQPGYVTQFIAVDPPFEALHADPRWEELLATLDHGWQAGTWPSEPSGSE